MQRHRLQRAQVHLAAAGDPQFPVRAQEANGAQNAQAMLWGQRVGALQRGALEGDEEVDRDRIGIDGFERFNRFDDLVVRLAQADDESRTRRESGAASLVDGVDTVGERMGRADVGVMGLRGVEIVIVGIDACFFESLRLSVLEESEASADFDAGSGGLDVLDHARDALDVPIRRTASGGDEADARGTSGQAEFRLAFGLLPGQPRVLEYLRFGAQTLRTVAAVLRAEAGLEVDEVVDLDEIAEVLTAQSACGRDEVEQILIRRRQDRPGVGGSGRGTGEHAVSE